MGRNYVNGPSGHRLSAETDQFREPRKGRNFVSNESGGRAVLVTRFFYGTSALAAVTFVVAWIIEGYEAEIHQRDAQVFTPHATVFFVIALVTLIVGIFVALRNK